MATTFRASRLPAPARAIFRLAGAAASLVLPPVCLHCDGRRFGSSRFLYRVTPELSTVVHGFKYRRMRRNARFLAARLRRRPDLIAHLGAFDALVPVPLHAARQRERGYNQAALIADAFGEIAG